MEGMRFVEAGDEHRAVLWKVEKVRPDHPRPPMNGESGESGESCSANLMRGFDSHNYTSAYARDANTCMDSAEKHSPDSPDSPAEYEREVIE